MEQNELLGKSKVYLPSLEYGENFQPKALNTNRKIDFDLLAIEPTDGKRAFTRYTVLPPIGHTHCHEIAGNTRETEKAEVAQLKQRREESNIKITNSTRKQRDWKKFHITSTSNSHLSLRRELLLTERRTSGAETLVASDDSLNTGEDNSAFEFSQEKSVENNLKSQEISDEAGETNYRSAESVPGDGMDENGVDENEQEKPTFSLWKTKMLRIMNRYKEKFQNVDDQWKENAETSRTTCTSEHTGDKENNNNSNNPAMRAGEKKGPFEIGEENKEDDEESDDVQPPSVSRRDAVCRTNDEQLHYFLLLRNLRDFGLI